MQKQVTETLHEDVVCRCLNRPVEGARPPPCRLLIHLKWNIYWKCFLRPQKTQAGHWLIKANLCSSCVCVCFRVSASISIALLSTLVDWITTLHGSECSAFQHYREYNIPRMEVVASEDELASSMQAHVLVILTGGANSTSDWQYYEFGACFLWFFYWIIRNHDTMMSNTKKSWDELDVLLIDNNVLDNNESHSCFKWQFNHINFKYCFLMTFNSLKMFHP